MMGPSGIKNCFEEDLIIITGEKNASNQGLILQRIFKSRDPAYITDKSDVRAFSV